MLESLWGLLWTVELWFRRPVEPDAIYAAVGLVGTAAALFFTLALLPAQLHYSAGMSVHLVHVILKDPRLKRTFATVFACVILELTLLFFGCNVRVLWIATSGAVIAFTVAAGFVRVSTGMLDFGQYLVPEIEKGALAKVDQAFRRLDATPPTPEQRAEDLKTIFDEVVATGAAFDKDNPKLIVPMSAVRDSGLASDMTALKDMFQTLLQRSDIHGLRTVTKAVARISTAYFQRRQDYQGSYDPLAEIVSRHIEELLRTTRDSKVRDYELIVLELFENVTGASLDTKPIGSKKGAHWIAMQLVRTAKEFAQLSILEGDMDSAFDTIQSLNVVASTMATRGFSTSAASIASDVAKMSLAVTTKELSPVILASRKLVAEVFYRTLAYRPLFTGYDAPIYPLVDAYKALLDAEAGTVAIWGLGDPIVSYDADMTSDRSLSSLVRVGLFPTALDPEQVDTIISVNIQAITKIIGITEKQATKKGMAQTFLADQLYQMFLWCLAFLDADLTLELLVYSETAVVPNPSNRKKVAKLALGILATHCRWRIADLVGKPAIEMYPDRIGHGLFSMWLLLLHRNVDDRLGIGFDLREAADKQLDALRADAGKITLSGVDRYNAMRFYGYLAQRKLLTKHRRWLRSAVLKAKAKGHGGIDEMEVLTHLRRPLVTFFPDLFGQLDQEIFGGGGDGTAEAAPSEGMPAVEPDDEDDGTL